MNLKYRSEIDGLRAIAVIPVILFHVGFETFSGGYSGVDVFFVISGYLITSIIYPEFIENRFSLITFYERRARRILPLLFFILLITIPFAWISLFQTDMVDYFQSLIAVPTFSSNFLFTFEANYFDAAVDLKPLLHTWSLAVEEQYYIFFPLSIMFFFLITKKRTLLLILIVLICIVSFILAEWASIHYPKHNFYLLPSRVWELGVGAILAILISDNNSSLLTIRNKKVIMEILGLVGLGLILLGVFIIKEDSPYPSSYTLLPVIGTALIIAFSTKNSLSGLILSSKPLVFVGLISYSAYLWHHPIFSFAKHIGYYDQSFATKSILSILVVPLSYLSWKFVENPFRNKQNFKRKSIFTFSIIGSVFFITLGIIGVKNNGFPNRDVNKRLEVRNYIPDNRKLQLDSWKNLNKAMSELKNNSWFDNKNSLPNMLIIGNSHSKDIYNVFKASKDASENFNIGRVQVQISEFSDPNHQLFNSQNYKSSDIIVIASQYRKDDIPHIEKLITRLFKDNKKVIIVRTIHRFKVTNGKTNADLIIQKYIRRGYNLEDDEIVADIVEKINLTYYQDFIINEWEVNKSTDKIIDSTKAIYPELIVLDRMNYICENGKCYATNSNLEKYFYDEGHHTIKGAEFFGERVDEVKWLAPLLNEALF
jgi:peptidoglycan/LPS O-acetylase OafA/YrhL